MNYHHLTIEERSCIRKYYVDGLSYREIARLIGRNVSTVSREIRRNCSHMYDIPTYYPHTAQKKYLLRRSYCHRGMFHSQEVCALPGFVDSKNEEKTERNAGYLVVSHSGGGMLRQGTRKGIRRTPANRGMRAHRIVKGLDISEDVCHGMCP